MGFQEDRGAEYYLGEDPHFMSQYTRDTREFNERMRIMEEEEKRATRPCGPGGFCHFENGVVVRTDDGCPTHSKRPGVAKA